jgi:hypothetical protein
VTKAEDLGPNDSIQGVMLPVSKSPLLMMLVAAAVVVVHCEALVEVIVDMVDDDDDVTVKLVDKVAVDMGVTEEDIAHVELLFVLEVTEDTMLGIEVLAAIEVLATHVATFWRTKLILSISIFDSTVANSPFVQ